MLLNVTPFVLSFPLMWLLRARNLKRRLFQQPVRTRRMTEDTRKNVTFAILCYRH